jgi:pimeloyl-ACP methyl ester carboxylesterase
MIFKFDREPLSITFTDGNVRLSGVLVEPRGPGPFPAVVFVHGAGPGTHDEPAFVVHANAFLKQGFAVLAYDKRGSGNSTGQLESSDYEDLARDVASAVAVLRTKAEIAPSQIGLLGRSEGAWVSTIAASKDPSIAFVILSSGSAVSPYEQTVFYTRRALRAKGTPEDRIEQAVSVKSAIWDFYKKVADGKTNQQVLRSERIDLMKRLAEFQQFRPELPEGIMDPEVEDRRKFAAFTNMIFYDPLPALTSLHAPLLEAIGANDEVVDPVTTLAALDHLRKSGQDITAKTFPGVGHSLLIMKGTTILGYAEGYLDFITAWARDHAHM